MLESICKSKRATVITYTFSEKGPTAAGRAPPQGGNRWELGAGSGGWLVAVAGGVAMVATVVVAASALPRALAGAAALPIVLLLIGLGSRARTLALVRVLGPVFLLLELRFPVMDGGTDAVANAVTVARSVGTATSPAAPLPTIPGFINAVPTLAEAACKSRLASAGLFAGRNAVAQPSTRSGTPAPGSLDRPRAPHHRPEEQPLT